MGLNGQNIFKNSMTALTSNDDAAPETFNPLFQDLLNNDIHLKTKITAIEEAASGYESPSGSQSKADAAGASAKSYTDTKLAQLINAAPAALDTLKELSDALGNDPNFATTVLNQLAVKANQTDFTNLSNTVEAHQSDTIYQTAGGTTTSITLVINTALTNGYPITFIASATNNGAATTINTKPLYKPNTTTAPTLIAGKAYTVWYSITSNCFFIKASAEGTATTAQVLAGVPFSNETDTGLIGTMTNNGSVGTVNLTTEGAEYTIPAGYHNGLGKVKAVISGILASVIKAGITVGGIVGTFTADATATATQMLSGAKAYVNGVLVTGTIASKAAATYNPSTVAQTIAAAQYLSGIQTINPVTGTATAADVMSGKTFASANGIGLTGTNTNKKWQSGSYVYPYALPQGTQDFSIPVSLPFVPNYVIINVYLDTVGYHTAGCFDRGTGQTSQPASYSSTLMFIPTGATATAITGSAEYGSSGIWEANRITLYWRVFE